MLSELRLHGWPFTKAEIQNKLQPLCSFIDKIAIKHDIAMKGRIIIISAALHDKVLENPHLNHMGIQKTRLLEYAFTYLFKMNRRIIVSAALHDKVLENPHLNHMGIPKTRLLEYAVTYLFKMNSDIGETKCLDFQAT